MPTLTLQLPEPQGVQPESLQKLLDFVEQDPQFLSYLEVGIVSIQDMRAALRRFGDPELWRMYAPILLAVSIQMMKDTDKRAKPY